MNDPRTLLTCSVYMVTMQGMMRVQTNIRMDMKQASEVIKGNELSDSTENANSDSTIKAGQDPEGMRSTIDALEIKVKRNGLPRGVKDQENVEASGRDKRLSPKAMLFAQYVMEGHTPLQAYEKSYSPTKSSRNTMISNANKLMRDSRITLLLEPFFEAKKEMILTDQAVTRRHVMKELLKHADAEDVPVSAKLRALELMGKAVGMFVDKVEQKVEEINVDSLKAELQSSLSLLNSSRHANTKKH